MRSGRWEEEPQACTNRASRALLPPANAVMELRMSDWLLLLGGTLLLYFGAEWFVGGASSLALALRVPQILVGLTVVAYGTSAPEIIVGVEAAAAGHGSVVIGNVVGSNVANIGLILGLTSLIKPPRVDKDLRRRELPVLLGSGLVLPLLLLDGEVGPFEAGGLLVCAFSYTVFMIRAARGASLSSVKREATIAAEAADVAGAPSAPSKLRAALIAVVGLATLLVGGQIFIDGAVSVAHAFGVSERLVGLTIVAVGTSLPELVTSLIAARRGHSDIAVGNVVGSNIFNTFLCLGAARLAGPVATPSQGLLADMVALVGMTALAAVFIRSERTITRDEGGLMLFFYVAFMAYVISRG
jgi:cation:H+ antiporter